MRYKLVKALKSISYNENRHDTLCVFQDTLNKDDIIKIISNILKDKYNRISNLKDDFDYISNCIYEQGYYNVCGDDFYLTYADLYY